MGESPSHDSLHEKTKLIGKNNYVLVMDAVIQLHSSKLIAFKAENEIRLNEFPQVCLSETRFTLCNCLNFENKDISSLNLTKTM